MEKRYQPMQPVELSSSGVARFRCNEVVRYLLDNGGIDLNDLAQIDFPQEDRDQFMQLINYSVSGAPITNDLRNAAQLSFEKGVSPEQARIEYLENELKAIREAFKAPISDLYNIHPDNLT